LIGTGAHSVGRPHPLPGFDEVAIEDELTRQLIAHELDPRAYRLMIEALAGYEYRIVDPSKPDRPAGCL
jgi:hypothetical protein